MRKVRDNYTAEIIITIVVLVMLLTSCGTTTSSVMKHGVSPKYMQLEKCMYADQEWDKE
tara:strand:- start:266 stop:442 length:177 start_codon:yes stop_codon:yes gene_type:complete